MFILILHNEDCSFKLLLCSAMCSVVTNILIECSGGRLVRFISLEVDETRDKAQLDWASSSEFAVVDLPDNKLTIARTTTGYDFLFLSCAWSLKIWIR